MSKLKPVDYDPGAWYWDPNDHLPVYVLEFYHVQDTRIQEGHTKYAKVICPILDPGNAEAMRNLDMKWMAATDLMEIRQQCEIQY